MPGLAYRLLYVEADPGHGHVAGGPHEIRGARCPNCKKPLLRFFSLSGDDSRLSPWIDRGGWLHMLFCWTCEVAQNPFFYALEGPQEVRLLEYGKRGVQKDFPYENYPVAFPHSYVELSRIPEKDLDLVRGVNCGRVEYSDLRGHDEEVCSPHHHLGRDPFLIQGDSRKPWRCVRCSGPMPLVATVADDAPGGMGGPEAPPSKRALASLFGGSPVGPAYTGNDFVQVVYYLCRACSVLGVQQQCD